MHFNKYLLNFSCAQTIPFFFRSLIKFSFLQEVITGPLAYITSSWSVPILCVNLLPGLLTYTVHSVKGGNNIFSFFFLQNRMKIISYVQNQVSEELKNSRWVKRSEHFNKTIAKHKVKEVLKNGSKSNFHSSWWWGSKIYLSSKWQVFFLAWLLMWMPRGKNRKIKTDNSKKIHEHSEPSLPSIKSW